MSAAAVTKLNILETNYSNFKINHNIAADSLYILTGNDVIINFRWATNRINMFILGSCLGVDFAIKVQLIYSFGTGDSSASLSVLQTVCLGLDICALLA